MLLVDSEDLVTDSTLDGCVAHLNTQDNWSFENVDATRVHLMTQCMETWIVADPDRLKEFYGQRFHESALPRRSVLDEEPKASLYSALDAATKDTQKGRYGKIRHASELLKRVRPSVVAARCTSFQRLIQWLDAAIAVA